MVVYTTDKNEIYIQHARNGGEKREGDYSLDGYHEETHTAYEDHGWSWHRCPKSYTGDTLNPVKGKTMQELHHCTVAKIEYLKRQSYNVVEVWECDVNQELKQNEDMKHYFDHYHMIDPLNLRHALYGGRTNASKLYHCCQGDEQIRNVDFTRVYPHVNRSKTVPTGHQEIITKNFDEDISNYFRLIKCTCADTGNQTPCTHFDAEKGYRIVQMHEVWHFPQKTDTLFKEYIDTFAKIKLEASGYPKDCVTDEQKQWYVNDILENQGHPIGSHQNKLQPGIMCLGQTDVEFVLGQVCAVPESDENRTD